MICTANRCREGRLECTRTECGYAAESAVRHARAMNLPTDFAEPEPEEFTQSEALTLCESAICFIIGAAAVTVLAVIAWQLLPVVVSWWR